jgi:hypothetical protein
MIRGTLYPRISDGAFAREWPDLVLAVSEPAAYLHARGLKLPGSRYLAILREVIRGIQAHGQPNPRNLPIYLRKCLQDHMRMQGERYLEEAKDLEARPTGAIADRITRGLRVVTGDPEAERLTAALVAARTLITAPRKGR